MDKSIYIAGPYSGTMEERQENTLRMIMVYNQLIHKGWFPYCPLLSHYASIRDGRIGYDTWMRIDIHWLLKCDALFFMGRSPGADNERLVAEASGKIIYTKMHDVPRLA